MHKKMGADEYYGQFHIRLKYPGNGKSGSRKSLLYIDANFIVRVMVIRCLPIFEPASAKSKLIQST